MRVRAPETFRGFCTNPPFAPVLVNAADIDQLREWLWHIRLWRVVVTVATDDLGPFDVDRVFKDGATEVLGGSTTDRYPTESEKVCPFATSYTQGSPLPQFLVEMGFTGTQTETLNQLECRVDFNFNGITFGNGTGDVSQPFPFTAFLDGQPFSCQSNLDLTTANVSISRYFGGGGFWPYARSDNTVPLWDTDDGTQLVASTDPEFIYVG